MIDAGSSGTRLYIYEYFKPSEPNLPLSIHPSRHPSGKQFSAKRVPGIATIEPTFLAVSAYLGPLIQEAAAFLDSSMHNDTNIYLKATGGMRLLPNPRKMLNAVRGVLGDKAVSPFRFEERNHAGIISGEHEGLYAWLTVNHLLGHLYSPKAAKPAVVLDLGGASTQIAFEPDEIPLSSHYSVTTSSVRHEIYTHSYLRFGVEEARKRLYASQIAQMDVHAEMMEDPCAWKGYNTTYTSSTGTVYHVHGTGHFEKCHKQIGDSLLGLHTFCPAEPCGINGVYQAPIPPHAPIYAISAFAFTAEFFECGSKSNLTCLLDNASNVCGTSTWSEVQQRYPKVPRIFLPGYCFGAAYMAQVLHQGYEIDDDRSINFGNFMEDGTEISWTLGAAIYEISVKVEESSGGQCEQAGMVSGAGKFAGNSWSVLVLVAVFVGLWNSSL
ncbi:hypothetical protein HK097_002403 [Rhizophlyctis rosea]|uniref:guanosine-diphosphatase n=1 Tax=Rhizophlyctis rosea TaxID=64517 RepID=A0AAD5S5C5_9FUNG|nr:hypothetical protein HK097_002403 [Rhizophlyctis rosea]